MNNYPIELKNISKTFRLTGFNIQDSKVKLTSIKAVNNVSLQVEKGKMVGFIGKNGSGKTTLLRIISGILQPDEGTVKTNGKLGPLLQVGVGINEEFTVAENIVMYGVLLGFSKKAITAKVTEILKFAELEDYRDVKMEYLSSGMKIRAMFSTAMLIDPDILLLDEIIAVGDLTFKDKSFEAFLSFKKRGKTIIFVSHNLDLIQKFCDIVYFMNKGEIVEYGEPEKVVLSYQKFCEENPMM